MPSEMIDIESALSGQLPANVSIPYPHQMWRIKTSAVLVPFLEEETGWKILYTQRSDQVADHRGQVSFPGGQGEAGDSGPLQTALREAGEEIGINPEAVRALGILDPVDTRTSFRIWPVVCVLKWPVPLVPSLPEVREVFFVPVEWLMQPENLSRRPVELTGGQTQPQTLFFEPYQGHIIWGATAAITLRLMEILREERTA